MTTSVVGLASLYEPLEFLENKIRNFNQCDMSGTIIYFSDCSSPETWAEVEKIVRSNCKFDFVIDHHAERKTLYWTWNWIIEHTRDVAKYYVTTNVDDILEPTYFKKMSAFLDEHPEFEIACMSWLVTEEKGQIWPPKWNPGQNQVVNPDRSCGHFPMWRASLHDPDRIGLFIPEMVVIGDAEFWDRIKRKYGLPVFGVHPEWLACFLSHEKNLYRTGKGPDGGSGEAWDWGIINGRKF
jgi:hypothetical protein